MVSYTTRSPPAAMQYSLELCHELSSFQARPEPPMM